MRSPLFVFPLRQFLQPLAEHEERLFHTLDSCKTAERRSDTERGQARPLRSETKQGHIGVLNVSS